MIYRNEPFNALFEEIFNRTFTPGREAVPTEPKGPATWTPALDAFVDGENFVMKLMLAGIDPKTVELSATGNRITVKGTRERFGSKETPGIRRAEVKYGPFERTVELPEGCDAAHAEAAFEHGVLTIKLPALGTFVPRKIQINAV
jgi:HSP20 family protein